MSAVTPVGASPTQVHGRSIVPIVAIALTIAASLAIGAAAGGSAILAIAGALALLAAVTVAMRPEFAVLIVVGLVYSNAPVVLTEFHGLPLVLAAAVPFVLVAALAYDLLVRREAIVVTPAFPWITLYLVVLILSTTVSRDVLATSDALWSFVIEGYALYFLVTNTVRSPGLIRSIIWVLLITGALIGALSLWQAVTGTYGSSYFGFAQTEAATTGVTETGVSRLAGPIGEKNRYAQIMLMLVPLGILQFSAERRQILRLGALACAALAAIAVALTFSRGAALAGGLILVAMVALRYIRLSHLLATVAVIAVVALAVPTYGERLTSLADLGSLFSDEPASSATDNSLLSRATENLAALHVFADHPVLGVGPDQFPNYYRAYADSIGVSVRAADRQAHNLYLETLAETGILGFVTFMGAVIATFIQLARARAAALTRRPDLAAMATGFLLALFAYMATGIFLHLSYARYFWLILALAGATASVVLQAMAEPDDAMAAGPDDATTPEPEAVAR